MSYESLRQARLDALIDVASAVLESLEDFNDTGASQLRENLSRFLQGLSNRLHASLDGRVASPGGTRTAPLPGSPSARRRETGAAGGEEPGAGAAASDWGEAEPSDGGTVGHLFGDEDFAESETVGALAAPRLPASREAPPTEAGGTEPLRAENERLRALLSSRQQHLLEVLGLGDVALDDDAEGDRLHDQFCRELKHLAHFFEKTKGNLDYIFGVLQIPVRIPSFSQRFSEALQGRRPLSAYLDDLRHCWQTIVQGMWMPLEPWCTKLKESLHPEKIEEESKELRQKPWQRYKDVFQRLSLYENLIETIKVKTEARTRSRVPELVR